MEQFLDNSFRPNLPELTMQRILVHSTCGKCVEPFTSEQCRNALFRARKQHKLPRPLDIAYAVTEIVCNALGLSSGEREVCWQATNR